jgi:hypothetical protein
LRAIPATVAILVAGWCAAAGAVEPLTQPTGPVVLTITGAIGQTNAPREARFDREMLERLGRSTIKTTTPWTDGVKTFNGVSLKAVLERVGAHGSQLNVSALNDYKVVIPVTDLQYEPLVAMEMDGRTLTRQDKGPLWIVYPRDTYKVLLDPGYDDHWVWQTSRMDVQ